MKVAVSIFAFVVILVISFFVYKYFPVKDFFSLMIPDFDFSLEAPVKNDKTNDKKNQSNDQRGAEMVSESGGYPQTSIVSGPINGEVIRDLWTIVYRFKGMNPKGDEGVTFQVKVSPIDENWKDISIDGYSFNLLPGDIEYTFQVRSKVGDLVDPTPSKVSFRALVSKNLNSVEIVSVDRGSYPNNPMKIQVRNNGEKEVDVTGWKISGGAGAYIFPKVVYDYFPSGSQELKNLNLSRGQNVEILGSANPLGFGIRGNICSGYLNNSFNLNPKIPENCPGLESVETINLSSSCKNYLTSLGCKTPQAERMNSLDADCRVFADKKMNYNGCYWQYRNLKGFFYDWFKIYMGNNIVSPKEDKIELRDKEGLLVDYFTI